MNQTKSHDGIDISISGDGDFRGTCQWHEDVCTQSPAAYVSSSNDTDVYCLRHYTLTLSQLAEVHLLSCPESLGQHVASYGRLAD